MVPGAAGAVAAPDDERLSEPTLWGVLLTGLPGVLREGFLPLGAFYAGLELAGLTAGIVASAVASLLIYVYERHRGRDALLVRLSLGFVVVQSVVGLVANSAAVYLAQPVLLAAAWGLAFLVSVVVGRPLAGALACAWYPFPQWLKESRDFKRVYAIESLVWGAYFLGRSALRLAVLLHGSIGGFLVITFVTGTPVTILLLVWSIRYAIRGLADTEPPAAA
jgi:Protein of unknown function (DUF3159)